MPRPASIRALSSLLILSVALSGCIGTLVDVATAPVKVVSKGVDLATTSQSERDEKRGRCRGVGWLLTSRLLDSLRARRMDDA